MTTSIPQRSVLLIGACQRILDDAVADLRDRGYKAQATSDLFSPQIGVINPRVIVIDSSAGSPGLIASQMPGAFTADRQNSAVTSTPLQVGGRQA